MWAGKAIALSMTVTLLSTGAWADDWSADKLRGIVLVQRDGQWVHLERGDTVPDSSAIRTTNNGYVDLVRNGETISVSPSTLLQVHDRSGRPFTTVCQAFGEVTVADKHGRAAHFAVVTPFIAAVVKGTIFTVKSGRMNASVSVDRGQVGVEDLNAHTFVNLGVDQHASAGPNQPMTVGGSGDLPPIRNAKGVVVSTVTAAGDVVAATLDEHGKPFKPAASPGAKGNYKTVGPKGDNGKDSAAKPDQGHSEGNGGNDPRPGNGNGHGAGNGSSGNGNAGGNSANRGNGNNGNDNGNGADHGNANGNGHGGGKG